MRLEDDLPVISPHIEEEANAILATIPADEDEPTDEIHDDAPDDVDDQVPEVNNVDTPADLAVEDATLEWSQDDEDLGEEGANP